MLQLEMAGDIPAGLDVKPLQAAITALNEISPDWLKPGVINLKLIDDAAIKDLNKEYSGEDKATDVLSFSYIEGGEDTTELGDIAISLETAARQAKAAGTSLDDEIATLGLHGVLHVLGFDHATAEDRRVMDRLQADILTAAKVTYRDFKWV